MACMLIASMANNVFARNVYSECPIESPDDVVAFCTEENNLGITFPARTISEFAPGFPGGEAGCLSTTPSPSWFIMQIDQEGMLQITMEHSGREDIDFACWGPFKGRSKSDVISQLCADPDKHFYNPDDEYKDFINLCEADYLKFIQTSSRQCFEERTGLPSSPANREWYIREWEDCIDYAEITVPDDILDAYNNSHWFDPSDPGDFGDCFFQIDPDKVTMVSCSYSSDYRETCTIPYARKGEWYILLITNYSEVAGDINFRKTAGTATTNCKIIIDATYSGNCEGDNLQFTVNNAPEGATFKWRGPNNFTSSEKEPVITNAATKHSGTYYVTMTNDGFTSDEIEVEVVINPHTERDTTILLEEGQTLIFGDKTISAEGLYKHNFTSITGCDSIVNLTVRFADSFVEEKITICEGEDLQYFITGISNNPSYTIKWEGPNRYSSTNRSLSINSITQDAGGLYIATITSPMGSVSLYQLAITVLPTDEKTENATLANNGTITFGDLTIKEEGTYKQTFKNIMGCDSVVTLIVAKNDSYHEEIHICEGVNYVSKKFSRRNDYTSFQWTGPNGYNSENELLTIENPTLNMSGTYIGAFTKSDGSIDDIEVEVTVHPTVQKQEQKILIAGDSLKFGDKIIKEGGEYTLNLTTPFQCDSTITLTVEEIIINLSNTGPYCEGEEIHLEAEGLPEEIDFEWIGPGFKSKEVAPTIENAKKHNSGDYALYINYEGHTAKTQSTEVVVMENVMEKIIEQLSFGQTITFGELIIDKGGEYTQTFKSAEGCDSIVTIAVQMIYDETSLLRPHDYFSPNGDGIFDTWNIENIELYPTARVSIYDRSGKLIRKYDSGYNNINGWDGKDVNGIDMPSTDYWYTIDVDMLDKIYVGHFTLLR